MCVYHRDILCVVDRRRLDGRHRAVLGLLVVRDLYHTELLL